MEVNSTTERLSVKQVRKRYGDVSCKTLWLWRRKRGFPEPFDQIAGRNYWAPVQLDAWDASRAAEKSQLS